MSWRIMLFYAVLIAVLYGAADVVFSSGVPQHSPAGTAVDERSSWSEATETASTSVSVGTTSGLRTCLDADDSVDPAARC